jgi:hypothetical protein
MSFLSNHLYIVLKLMFSQIEIFNLSAIKLDHLPLFEESSITNIFKVFSSVVQSFKVIV